MRREIAAVVFFLKRLVKKRKKLESHKVELFVQRLAAALQEKFKGHWYPENPTKGQAYRCIRVNRFHWQDPELLQACRESGVHYSDLGLPHELTLWVDPGEVCCRYGEQNPYFTVVTFPSEDEDDKDVAKVTSTLERVTSDYHSGSSSDEENTQALPVTVPSRRCTDQTLNPTAAPWHPRKMFPGKGHLLLRPHYGYRPRSSVPNTLRHSHWVPSVYRGGPRYWDPNLNMSHGYN